MLEYLRFHFTMSTILLPLFCIVDLPLNLEKIIANCLIALFFEVALLISTFYRVKKLINVIRKKRSGNSCTVR